MGKSVIHSGNHATSIFSLNLIPFSFLIIFYLILCSKFDMCKFTVHLTSDGMKWNDSTSIVVPKQSKYYVQNYIFSFFILLFSNLFVVFLSSLPLLAKQLSNYVKTKCI